MTTQEPKTPSLRSAFALGSLEPTLGNEAELVGRAKSGCSAAFEQLYNRYNGRLYGIALRMLQNREDAEDAVQETFRRALLNLGKFRGDALFLIWLTRIVINESLMAIRRRKRKHQAGEGESSEAARAEAVDSAPTPEKRYESQEVQIAIHQAISSLQSKLRSVVLLCELSGCTAREAAQELGITISAAKARMHRARHDMRVHIERRHSAAHAAFLYQRPRNRCWRRSNS